MRTFLQTLTAVLLAAALGGPVLAAGRANPNRGKTLYKATCKACHVKGGEAANLSPLSKTQAQWQRVFKANVAACVKKVETRTGKPLTAQDLADMELYLVSHAADSDQPETCGQ